MARPYDLGEIVKTHLVRKEKLGVVEDLKEKIRVAEKKCKEMLLIERDAARVITEKISDYQTRIKMLENSITYPMLDLSFLKWRKRRGFFVKKPWPCFAVFPMTDTRFQLSFYPSKRYNIRGGMLCYRSHINVNDCSGDDLHPYFEDLYPIWTKGDEERVIEWQLNNVILPDDVRRETVKAMGVFGSEHVYFVKEIDYSKGGGYTLTVNRDPLIIGIQNKLGFLVAKFDLTPMEEYVAAEFGI